MSTHPNLLFVVPDEFRPYSMGFLGREPVVTPNLDRFSRDATTFTNMVSNYPVCSPYRGMLFTGKYPYRNGVVGNCNSQHASITLPEDSRLLSDLLSDCGYNMGYIGKWHLQAPRPGDEQYGEGPRENGVVWDTYTPPGKGRHKFDYWYSYGCCDNHNHPHYWTADRQIDEAIHVDQWSTIHETDVAVDYLKNTHGQRDADKPFALFVAYNPPHMPFDQVPERYQDIYKGKRPEELAVWKNLNPEGMELIEADIANYFAMISGVDDQFGRLLDTLTDQGLADDTIVIFTSDHGDMMGSHGQVRKGQWYNESLLVPFLVRFPGAVRPGVLDDALLSTVDIYPTLLGMLGLGDSVPSGIDGIDCSARIADGTSPTRDAAFYMRIDHLDCTTGNRGIKTDRYTYAFEKTSDRVEYYCVDNIEDPDQMTNVYGTDPERDRLHRKRLEEFLVQAEDPFAGWTG